MYHRTTAVNHMSPRDPRSLGLIKALYSVNETLTTLSIGRTTLYRLVDRGDLCCVKVGKKTLFTAENIAGFLNKLSAKRPAPENAGSRGSPC